MTDGNQHQGVPRDEAREQNREGQNQSAPRQNQGGQAGQDHELAAMEGQKTDPRGRQGQPKQRAEGDGEHGGNR